MGDGGACVPAASLTRMKTREVDGREDEEEEGPAD